MKNVRVLCCFGCLCLSISLAVCQRVFVFWDDIFVLFFSSSVCFLLYFWSNKSTGTLWVVYVGWMDARQDNHLCLESVTMFI